MMAYDYFNFGDDRHSSYAIAQHCLDYFTSLGFKPEQLILGLPFYRRTMDATHQHGGGYNTIVERWRKGVKPWVNVVTNKTWVYYFNGPNMLRDKVYFAMNNNMSGVFCWSMRNDISNDNIYGVASLGQTVIDSIERFGG
jgi:GH18 family chitinase